MSLKEPWKVDEAADSDDNEEIFKNSDVDILRSSLYPVLVRLTDCKVSEEEEYIRHCLIFTIKPFKGNEDDEIDGAAERDVVERVEQLWEDVGIELALLGEGPAEHWNRFIS